MKTFVRLALLPVFLFSIFGWQWMFIVKLYSHEEAQWNSADANETYEMIAVPVNGNSEGTYFINGKELIHQGKLFDVKFKMLNGNRMLCWCERDGSEENLLSDFNGQTLTHFDTAISPESKSLKVVKVSVFESLRAYCYCFSNSSQDNLTSFFKIPFHSSAITDSVFVPPDVA
jgi:hypothetical protein